MKISICVVYICHQQATLQHSEAGTPWVLLLLWWCWCYCGSPTSPHPPHTGSDVVHLHTLETAPYKNPHVVKSPQRTEPTTHRTQTIYSHSPPPSSLYCLLAFGKQQHGALLPPTGEECGQLKYGLITFTSRVLLNKGPVLLSYHQTFQSIYFWLCIKTFYCFSTAVTLSCGVCLIKSIVSSLSRDPTSYQQVVWISRSVSAHYWQT